MPRYFIAIGLPSEIKDQLAAAQPAALPGMRLIERDEMHLTLHFLGEVSADCDERLRSALASFEARAFTVSIRGVGRFPPEGEPQVLWAGVADNASLLALHAAIGAVLQRAIGYQGERRAYSPHVTLARLNSPVPANFVNEYLNANRELCTAACLVTQFALYSSDFSEGSPKYRQEAAFHLA